MNYFLENSYLIKYVETILKEDQDKMMLENHIDALKTRVVMLILIMIINSLTKQSLFFLQLFFCLLKINF